MKLNRYQIIIIALSAIVLLLCVIKVGQSIFNPAIETNYIGDLESENKDQNNEDENIVVEEVEPLEFTGIIRVLLMDTGFQNVEHEKVEVSAENGLQIYDGDEILYIEAGAVYEIESLNDVVQIYPLDENDKIIVNSIERSYGNPEYYGMIEIFSGEEGLAIINEIDLELYLQGVLPSEMPSSYDIEALKAQAVCARSYAYNHVTSYSYPEYEAHVDDSTSYQVYNNLEENETCNLAIVDTAGEMLGMNGEVVTTYFFSTSCGHTTDISAWGSQVTEENAYLEGISVSDGEVDYEKDLAWYAWEIEISEEVMQELIEINLEKYRENLISDEVEGEEVSTEETDEEIGLVIELDEEGEDEILKDIGELESIIVVERGTGDIVLGVELNGSLGSIAIETEYQIRSILASSGETGYVVELQDGRTVEWSSILPSAFFEISYNEGTYYITGGGYGHGIGMSQNGANEMAKLGFSYVEILQFFYTGTEIFVSE